MHVRFTFTCTRGGRWQVFHSLDSIRLIDSFIRSFVRHVERRARLIDIICERVYCCCTLYQVVISAGRVFVSKVFAVFFLFWHRMTIIAHELIWSRTVSLYFMEHFSSNCVRRYIDKYQWAVNNCHKDSKKWLCQYRAHTKRKLKKLKPSFVIFCFFLPFYYYLIDRLVIGDSFTFNDSGDTTFNFSISIIALHYTLHLYTDGCWCMIWFGNNITSKYKYSTNIDTTGRQTEPLLATGYATRYKIGSFFEVQF